MNDYEDKIVVRILCALVIAIAGVILFVTLFIMSLLDDMALSDKSTTQHVCECINEEMT